MTFTATIIGCITGFISAFFGFGGSSIDTPLLNVFLHLPPYVALGTPLPVAILTIFIALSVYWKSNLINYRVFLYSALGGLPGVMIGSYLSQFFPGKILMILTAGVLFFIGLNFLMNDIHKKEIYAKKRQNKISSGYILIMAIVGSVVSGILANGGGLFFVAIYVMLFGMKIKEAIATSLLTVAVLILPSSAIHFYLGHIDLDVSLAMSLGVIPMAYAGAKLDLRTRSSTIKMLFGFLLIAFSLYFFGYQFLM